MNGECGYLHWFQLGVYNNTWREFNGLTRQAVASDGICGRFMVNFGILIVAGNKYQVEETTPKKWLAVSGCLLLMRTDRRLFSRRFL